MADQEPPSTAPRVTRSPQQARACPSTARASSHAGRGAALAVHPEREPVIWRSVQATFKELEERLAEIVDLRRVARLASWDQHVMMPAGGAAARAEQLATLDKVAHGKFVSAEIGRLLEALRPYEEQQPYESDEASPIRMTRRDWEKERRVPTELSAEITRAGAMAYEAWVEARRNSDFA